MKKIITILLLTTCAYIQAQTVKTMQIDIRGRGCHGGLGLCSVETVQETAKIVQKYNLIKITDNKLMLQINPKTLTIEEQIGIFGKTYATIEKIDFLYFTQDENFELSPEAIKNLGLNNKFNIVKKGSYLIKFNNNTAEVTLVLTNKT